MKYKKYMEERRPLWIVPAEVTQLSIPRLRMANLQKLIIDRWRIDKTERTCHLNIICCNTDKLKTYINLIKRSLALEKKILNWKNF